ncbi:MAG: hypothetical protein LBB76_03100, partial [Azoarcus sp.]|nr:hypothetical protein [Azoarcus sp.]
MATATTAGEHGVLCSPAIVASMLQVTAESTLARQRWGSGCARKRKERTERAHNGMRHDFFMVCFSFQESLSDNSAVDVDVFKTAYAKVHPGKVFCFLQPGNDWRTSANPGNSRLPDFPMCSSPVCRHAQTFPGKDRDC